jgi:hypothetical protein
MARVFAHVRGNVVAYLALFVALGGTSYAAVKLPAASVGTKQLKNGAVTAKKIRTGAVGAAAITPGALTAAAFAPGTLLQGAGGPAGPIGPKGAMGPAGAAGPAGPTAVVQRYGSSVNVATNQIGTASASCNAGERATGGGFWQQGGEMQSSRPMPLGDGATATGWQATLHNTTASTHAFGAYAMCAAS